MKDHMCSCLLSPNLTGYLLDLPNNIWVHLRTAKNVDADLFLLKLGFHEEKSGNAQDSSHSSGRSWVVWFHWQSHERHPYKAVIHHENQGMWYVLKLASLSLAPFGIACNSHQHADAYLPSCKIPCTPGILQGDNRPVGMFCLLGKFQPYICSSAQSDVVLL